MAFAQGKTDSLYNIWEDQMQVDSVRAIALKEFIYQNFFYSQPDSALILADVLFDFSEKANYRIGMVDALKLSGYTYFRMGNYPKALESYQAGLQLSEEIGDKQGAADILMRTGYIYHDNEDIVSALSFYQRSLKIFEELNDLVGIGAIYNEYGSLYRANEEYEKSLEYYFKSISINEQLTDPDRNAAMYINIGHVYLARSEFDEALEYFRRGLVIYEKSGDKLGIASGHAGIGYAYADMGNDNEALEFLERSLEISSEIDDAQGSAATLLAIADIFDKQSRPAFAIRECEKSLALATSLGDLGNQMASCECLYRANKQIGNIKAALEYHESMLEFIDSMQSEEAAINLQQMEFARQVMADSLTQAEKEMNIQLAHQAEVQKKDMNRNMAIGAGIFFLLLAGGFFSRWQFVKKSKAILEVEKARSENLLLNILPAEIAEELKEKGEAAARDYELVSILFTDFKSFTEKSASLSASELIAEINHCFKAFDLICEKYSIEKIKTIGDAYMAAGGLPVPSENSVQRTVMAALEMQSYIVLRQQDQKNQNHVFFEMRVGIHTGPVVAGIVGIKKFQYDVWGDTVNTASRMEEQGLVGKVNVSDDTYQLIKNDPNFNFETRGKINVKGKGELRMWFVNRAGDDNPEEDL
ncbi:MAG: tetratricopeptide repeat protein [Saprospiraceae bacterium]|nr:tetratricopeptide repeat protein [Saprospiraceae bacterium]